jgi:SAM-dependent methyltransferase
LKKHLLRFIDKTVDAFEARTAALGDDVVRRVGYVVETDRLLSSVSSRTPDQLFRGVSDEYWLWLNTEGYRINAELRRILPSLPSESFQYFVAGRTGDDTLLTAFPVYVQFRGLIETHYRPLANCEAILDFGCGWGRITRFFIKDLAPARLWGIDMWEAGVEHAKQTNPWSNFMTVNKMPPTSFDDDTFDVVFAYSVFSHISEDLHARWLGEFSRILKPGGLMIATTWGRNYIEYLESIRRGDVASPSWIEHHHRKVKERFPGLEACVAEYDRGDFCHVDSGIEGYEDYGETMISKRYVLSHWGGAFTVVDYIDDRARDPQNIILVKKGT